MANAGGFQWPLERWEGVSQLFWMRDFGDSPQKLTFFQFFGPLICIFQVKNHFSHASNIFETEAMVLELGIQKIALFFMNTEGIFCINKKTNKSRLPLKTPYLSLKKAFDVKNAD